MLNLSGVEVANHIDAWREDLAKLIREDSPELPEAVDFLLDRMTDWANWARER